MPTTRRRPRRKPCAKRLSTRGERQAVLEPTAPSDAQGHVRAGRATHPKLSGSVEGCEQASGCRLDVRHRSGELPEQRLVVDRVGAERPTTVGQQDIQHLPPCGQLFRIRLSQQADRDVCPGCRVEHLRGWRAERSVGRKAHDPHGRSRNSCRSGERLPFRCERLVDDHTHLLARSHPGRREHVRAPERRVGHAGIVGR